MSSGAPSISRVRQIPPASASFPKTRNPDSAPLERVGQRKTGRVGTADRDRDGRFHSDFLPTGVFRFERLMVSRQSPVTTEINSRAIW